MYSDGEPAASLRQIQVDLLVRQSWRRLRMILSPGSRVMGLGYWRRAVARTTRNTSKTGLFLISLN